MKRINSLEELITAIEEGNNDFFINLGPARSSKNITYNDGIFYIINEIDGTEQELNTEQLFDKEYTNIGLAINLGTFYQY